MARFRPEHGAGPDTVWPPEDPNANHPPPEPAPAPHDRARQRVLDGEARDQRRKGGG